MGKAGRCLGTTLHIDCTPLESRRRDRSKCCDKNKRDKKKKKIHIQNFFWNENVFFKLPTLLSKHVVSYFISFMSASVLSTLTNGPAMGIEKFSVPSKWIQKILLDHLVRFSGVDRNENFFAFLRI